MACLIIIILKSQNLLFWINFYSKQVEKSMKSCCLCIPTGLYVSCADSSGVVHWNVLQECIFLCPYIVTLVCVYPSVLDALTTPQLLPSASFRRHNFSRLIIAVNHCCLPTVFYPAAPLCPCPLPPTLLRARLATARRNELSCIWETGWKEETGFKSRWWAHCSLWWRLLSPSNLERWGYFVDLD